MKGHCRRAVSSVLFPSFFLLLLLLLLLLLSLSGCTQKDRSPLFRASGDSSLPPEDAFPASFSDPYPGALPISSAGTGHGSILRIKSDKSLLFSPYIAELSELLEGGASLWDFRFELTFTLLDENGKAYYTYPTVEDPPVTASSGYNYFNFYFGGSGGQMDFCPVAGRRYDIEVGIRDKSGKPLFYGVYPGILTPDEFSSNRYYRPTEIPKGPDDRSHILFYGVSGEGGRIEGENAQQLSYGMASSAVRAVPAEGYRFLRWSDGVGSAAREGDTTASDRALYALFIADTVEDHGVPILCVEVANGEQISDTYTWKECSVTVRGDASEGLSYAGSRLGAAVRGRGNGSWEQSARKKPYKIKFNKKINLFGIGGGEAKDWVLLPQAKEYSFLRTFMAFRMGQLLSGIDYASGFALVEVYLNGEYMGVYQLAEQVEVQESRIRVTEESDGDEIGFLVELDRYASGYGSFTVREERYQVKSEMQTSGQLRYISYFIRSVDLALYAGDREKIEELIDLDSFVDMFLLQEYLKNTDAGWSSFYMYKEIGGKLRFGAPWDFDLSQGNDPRFRDGAWDGFDGGEGYSAKYDQDNEWFVAIWRQRWFRELAYARWLEITDSVIPQMWEEGLSVAENARTAIDANFKKWKTLPEGKSYDDCLLELTDWLKNRKKWMDENFPYCLTGEYQQNLGNAG